MNAGYWNGFFIPTQAEAFWKQVNIKLTSIYNQPDVLFRFRVFGSVHGNNFYLDDVNIGNAQVATGIVAPSDLSEISLYPNPAASQSTLSIGLSKADRASVKIYDINGREAARVFEGNMGDGITQLEINGSTLAPGVYIVNIQAGGSVAQRKLVIK
jgi:hypothetical protein